MRRVTDKSIIAEINITPLTDVFLVLLIIVIIVAPFMASMQKGVRPPQVLGGSTLDRQALTLEIDRDGQYFLEGRQVPGAELVDTLSARVPSLPEKTLVIRGDRESQSAATLTAMDAARSAGVEQVILAGISQTEPRVPLPPRTGPSGPRP